MPGRQANRGRRGRPQPVVVFVAVSARHANFGGVEPDEGQRSARRLSAYSAEEKGQACRRAHESGHLGTVESSDRTQVAARSSL